jgi:FtsH-binding integral membrane protein
MRAVTGGVLDVCCVGAFVAIGRASHGEGETVAGLARTLWPFLAGLAVGWLITRAWRRPQNIAPVGAGVWLSTVALGMVLRIVSGQGSATAFVFVALAFLGLFMLGWRALQPITSRFATSRSA